MAQFKDSWFAHQRKRWMCPDAHRWFAPNYKTLFPQQRKAGFNPDQPRDELGQWTETGAEEEPTGADSFTEAAPPDELSSAERPRGHHFVARYAYRNLPLQHETKKVFDQATTGPLSAGPHR